MDNFLKGYSVLVRVEIIHKSKFLPGTVEKNSSTIRSSGRKFGMALSVNYWLYERNFCMVITIWVLAVE